MFFEQGVLFQNTDLHSLQELEVDVVNIQNSDRSWFSDLYSENSVGSLSFSDFVIRKIKKGEKMAFTFFGHFVASQPFSGFTFHFKNKIS